MEFEFSYGYNIEWERARDKRRAEYVERLLVKYPRLLRIEAKLIAERKIK